VPQVADVVSPCSNHAIAFRIAALIADTALAKGKLVLRIDERC
jgi:hypothetical protein